MKWIRDNTGRFPSRPFFEDGEMDSKCEVLVSTYLQNKYNEVRYPISTNDLTIIIEQYTDELDLYADLSDLGENIEGVTEFNPEKRPRVRISHFLTEDSRRENRLRTTLAHELGHVHLHNSLWMTVQGSLFADLNKDNQQRCNRDSIINAKEVDWMEWQAGYASGAFLMPFNPMNEIIHAFYSSRNVRAIVPPSSPIGTDLIRIIQKEFQVSEDAARVRLLKLNFLTEDPKSPIF